VILTQHNSVFLSTVGGCLGLLEPSFGSCLSFGNQVKGIMLKLI